ncbi:patatin-like phospholipase family protein [Pedobacter ginsengisoli]|uniref:patatin-like phospholipase family protein n=1 Tax=Pedobacter ginsengisoli TaxID=363852 RepID=UPI00254C32CA|nr:patatin-like phospholipase family protein [Pedobacter ginsengisoli]
MRIGVVFSGGGARGIAHLGGLQALEELGIRPAMISGVSAGALIGALYAAGKSPMEILEMIKQQSHSSLAAPADANEIIMMLAGIAHDLTVCISSVFSHAMPLRNCKSQAFIELGYKLIQFLQRLC